MSRPLASVTRRLPPPWPDCLNARLGRALSKQMRRESTGLSCWYVGEHESAAMWLLYAAEGIAIETTFSHFLQSLPKGVEGDGSSPIQVGLVRYVDYETALMPPGNSYWPFIHKRLSFAHEQELRAVIHHIGPNMVDHTAFQIREGGVPPGGVSVPVSVGTLVQKVHVAPSSPAWFADAVKAAVDRFGYGFPVVQSLLDVTPFH